MKKPRAPTYSQLRAFASFVLSHHPDYDLDGGDIQETAERNNLLISYTATQRCGKNCPCAEYSDFPRRCLKMNTTRPKGKRT